jgi:hypothetical protein
METDRILLIPVIWAPDPTAMKNWTGVQALMERLRACLPLDIFAWPTLRGEQHVAGALDSVRDAMRRQVRPVHHVLDCSTLPEYFFWAMGDPPVRSHVVAGFMPMRGISHEAGDPLLVTALEAVRTMLSSPSRIVHLTMQGAGEAEIKGAIAQMMPTYDSDLFRRIFEEESEMTAVSITPSRAPTLYLFQPFGLPGEEDFFEIFERYAPNAEEGGSLHEWPVHLHQQASGHELADKALPFIQRVIAEREQT